MKRVLILNGAPTPAYAINQQIDQLDQALQMRQHQVKCIILRDLDVRHCTGCWSCWVKTPGVCIHTDDVANVLRQILQADLLIMASPMIMGHPSALLKRFMDRMIPLVHPYVQWDRGECHHYARYKHYPRLALYLEKEADSDGEDIAIVSDLMARAARNLKSSLLFTHVLDDNMEEVCNEIDRF